MATTTGGPSAGRLVVLEGPEGAGKTTQLARLRDWLADRRYPVLAVREPGTSELGGQIRQLLLDPAMQITSAAEALLFMAARAQLVAREIEPALRSGTHVLCDRFFLSTYAYQGAGRGLDLSSVRAANRLATGGLVPDLTLLLDVDPAVGMARATARGAADRMELAGAGFHERVSGAFRRFAEPAWQTEHPECGPIELIDAAGEPDAVFARVLRVMSIVLPETFSGASRS